jgi:hypothetical protein
MHLQEPELFWITSNGFLKRPVLLKYWLLRPLFYKEATSKISTKKGILYSIEYTEEREKGTLSDQPKLSCIISTVLLCCWGQQLLKDMTPLRTDFETHAIWQGCIEDPAAKDFVARNACTIALSKAQGSCHRTSNNQPYSQDWKFLGDLLPKGYCATQQGLCHVGKWSLRIFVSKKGMIRVRPMDVYTRNLWQKTERGKITGIKSTTRFMRESCFEKLTHSVPEIWGHMYNVLPQSVKGTRK